MISVRRFAILPEGGRPGLQRHDRVSAAAGGCGCSMGSATSRDCESGAVGVPAAVPAQPDPEGRDRLAPAPDHCHQLLQQRHQGQLLRHSAAPLSVKQASVLHPFLPAHQGPANDEVIRLFQLLRATQRQCIIFSACRPPTMICRGPFVWTQSWHSLLCWWTFCGPCCDQNPLPTLEMNIQEHG